MVSQPYRDGNDLLGIQKGMTPVFDVNSTVLIQAGLTAFIMTGQGSFGKDKIQAGENLQIQRQAFGVRGKLIAQIREHSFDFFMLLNLQGTQLIVELDNGHGFDKKCGAGGRLIVHHTSHLVFVFCPYRQAVTAVTHGDNSILQIAAAGI